MKTLAAILVVVVLTIIGYYAYKSMNSETLPEVATSTPATQLTELPEIIPIEHATAIIDWQGTTLLTDPTDAQLLAGRAPADIVLITDIHQDHFSTSTLKTLLASSSAPLIVPKAVADLLPGELKARALILNNGESTTTAGLSIRAVPMYNMPEATSSFHIKGRGNGYIIEKGETSVYVAGDTGGTPEMRALTGIDIALIPMNLPYTMSVEDAAAAVLAFKPNQVYPYHYRGQDGLSDINKFKELVNAGDPNINVVLANWYPNQQ